MHASSLFLHDEIGLRIIGENSHFPSLHKISLKFFIYFDFIIKKSKNKACPHARNGKL